MLCRRLFAEVGDVVAIEGSVVGKAAFIKDEGRLLSRCYAFVSEEQPLFCDVFFWRVMQLVFDEPEQVALGDEAMGGDLGDILDRAQMRVDV